MKGNDVTLGLVLGLFLESRKLTSLELRRLKGRDEKISLTVTKTGFRLKVEHELRTGNGEQVLN